MRYAARCAVALVAALAGCKDSSGPEEAAICPPTGVAISVGEGLSPLISWEPQCRASQITVKRVDPTGAEGATVWSHGLDPAARYVEDALPESAVNRLSSPVAYGIRAPHLSVSAAPPLDAGQRYIVELEARAGTPYTTLYRVASQTFER